MVGYPKSTVGPALAPAPRRKAPVGCHPDPVGDTRGTPRDPKTEGVWGQTHQEPLLWAWGGGVQGTAVTPNPELWDGGGQGPMGLWGNPKPRGVEVDLSDSPDPKQDPLGRQGTPSGR